MRIQLPSLLALAVLAAASPLHAAILSSKRGFGDTSAGYGDLQAVNAGWYYNWGTAPSNSGNYNSKFYSMIWGSGQSSDSTINYALSVTSDYLLGFNEPERTDQANLSVSTAASIWDRMYTDTSAYNSAHGTSIKLVSPAVSDTSAGETWLKNFMASEGSKVDAVAFHWYDDSTTDGTQAAYDFENKVQWYHNTFNKPVFITEFADHDWGGTLGTANVIAANTTMLNMVVPWLESQNYVLGYSWYNWFSDSHLFTTTGATLTPTSLSYTYIGAVPSGTTTDLAGQDLGEHVADLTGGTLTQTSPGNVRYIDALANASSLTGSINWGLTSSSNWVRIQPGATLNKTGSNTITFACPVANDGTLQVSGSGVLALSSAMSGAGSLLISSTGDSVGSTARFELSGNINIPHPVTFAQRNDAGHSDGIRNVSGNNTLSGPLTITYGGNQARIQSDAGLLTLAGPISTDATSARNLYLQGNGNGLVSGVISNNPSNANGTINLYKEGNGTWTLTAANTYTGNTTISGGTLRLSQIASSAVAATAVANYSFDSVSGSTVLNAGTGGAGMNGSLVSDASIVPGGRFGNALSLAGNGYLNVNSFVTSMASAGNWSLSAWVKTATPGGTLLTKSGGGWASGNSIFYLGDGVGPGAGGIPSAVRYAGGFYQASTAAPSVTDNNWHLVTYVNNAGNYAIYIDGAAVSLSDGYNSFSNNDSSSSLRIGATTDAVASDGTVNFNGLLDNVQIYNQALTAPQIAALYAGAAAGALPSSSNVSISAGATLDVNGTVQQIANLSGAPGSAITLGSGLLAINASTNSQFAGNISGTGGSLVKQGPAALTLSGVNTLSGGITVSGGTLIAASPSALGGGPLTIHAAGNVQLQPGLPQAVLLPQVTFDGSPGGWMGKLDLASNALIVQDAISHAAALATLEDQVATGAITSSILPANTAIAVVDNAVAGLSTFDNQSVNAGSLIVAPLILGDANADGTVTADDLQIVLNHFGQPATAWTSGDFTGDPTIDLTDLSYVLNNFGLTNPNISTTFSAQSSVPEPSFLAVSLLAPILLALRFRRRRPPVAVSSH